MGVVIATLTRPRRGALWPKLPSGGPEVASMTVFDYGVRWWNPMAALERIGTFEQSSLTGHELTVAVTFQFAN